MTCAKLRNLLSHDFRGQLGVAERVGYKGVAKESRNRGSQSSREMPGASTLVTWCPEVPCCGPIRLILAIIFLSACTSTQTSAECPEPRSIVWFERLEGQYHTGDGAGHGPDIGSDEWKSVIEFKLGIRDRADVPNLQSPEWCTYIDDYIKQPVRQ